MNGNIFWRMVDNFYNKAIALSDYNARPRKLPICCKDGRGVANPSHIF